MTTKICYIWAAQKSEPGQHGKRYAATSTSTPPEPIQPVKVPHARNLVYQESMYGNWELLGTAKGECYENDYGYFVVLETPENTGRQIDVSDLVRLGWYTTV